MNLPACFLARLPQGFQKPLAILVILENIIPSIPSTHDVIDRPGIFDSQLSSHAQTLIIINRRVKHNTVKGS